MQYDKDYVAKWREKAITKLEDLKIGETYYTCSRSCKSSFQIVAFLSWQEHWRRKDFDDWRTAGTEIGWFITNHGETWSLRDNNVGASYSPWLIFARESDLKEYEAGLNYTLGDSDK